MRRQELLDQVGLVGQEIIRDHVDLRAARLVDHQIGEEGDELGRGVRVAVSPRTSPFIELRGTYNDRVPWRLRSKLCCSARPGEGGSTRSSRSRA
jgi:hypothetical protein